MRRLLLLLAVVVGAAGLATWAWQDPGYVFISRAPWSIELSLTLAILLLLLAFLLLHAGARLFHALLIAPAQLRQWHRQRRALRGLELVRRGEIELAEGRWRAAERHLVRAGRQGASPLLAYLGAARAAQRQHAHERRDHYLRLAHRSEPDADQAVLLTQAELQSAHAQHEEALASLMHLRSLAPRHRHVLALLARLHREMGAWDELGELLPELARRRALAPETLDELSRETHRALLERARQSGRVERLREVWGRLPRALRREADLLHAYALGLHEAGADDEAEPLLRKWLRHNPWNAELVRLYGNLHCGDTGRQLTTAERWLAENERDPHLLLALGRLARRHSLWGKARLYLESSIAAEPRAETYRELGTLLEELGDERAAMDCYRKGIHLAPRPPRTPAPQSPAGSNASV